TITNCYIDGGNVSGTKYVGGLVGINFGIITDCYSTGSVSGDSSIGGLVGYNQGTITDCYSTGSVSGDSRVGGLVGGNGGTITNSYASGSVSAYEEVGGLVGRNYDTITNCYSTGRVSGIRDVGGLVGYNYKGTVRASFWDIETSGKSTSDGGMGLPTAEMQTMSTFTDAGWRPSWRRISNPLVAAISSTSFAHLFGGFRN
ncbi:MAG: GLUG motif-containing protein, partial [Planctomycetota bacterium]